VLNPNVSDDSRLFIGIRPLFCLGRFGNAWVAKPRRIRFPKSLNFPLREIQTVSAVESLMGYR